MPQSTRKNRPDKAEVTPAMIAAGSAVLHDQAGDDIGQIACEAEIITSMFRAMVAASLSSSDRQA